MEHTSSESIAAALKLLEEAAKQKRDEVKTAMSDKYASLKSLVLESEGSLMASLTNARDCACEAAAHAKEVTAEKAHAIASEVDESVHRNPWLYIAGASVIGLLLGGMLSRSRK
jgi:ElaB/YqjD/DUF883 family membrane-anchored ribosome-binding protein